MLTEARKIELLTPYSEDGRTYEGQFNWLVKRHAIDAEIAIAALERIYSRLDMGEVWPSGHHLDRALLDDAKALTAGHASELIEWLGRRILEFPSTETKNALRGRDAAVADLEGVFAELNGLGRVRKAWLAIRGKL